MNFPKTLTWFWHSENIGIYFALVNLKSQLCDGEMNCEPVIGKCRADLGNVWVNSGHQQQQNLSTPTSTPAGRSDAASVSIGDDMLPISFCAEGVFMWLLLVWMTTGTAAIAVLFVKGCRNRYHKSRQNKSIRRTQANLQKTWIEPAKEN